MPFKERQKDPELLPVQLNARIPFYLREIMIEAANKRRMSQGQFIQRALERELASEIKQYRQTNPDSVHFQTKDASR